MGLFFLPSFRLFLNNRARHWYMFMNKTLFKKLGNLICKKKNISGWEGAEVEPF